MTSAVRASTASRARSAAAASTLEIVTVPSSSISIRAPVSASRPLIVLPPGPITLPILSGLIFTWMSRGACLLISARGAWIVSSIVRRISRRTSRAF